MSLASRVDKLEQRAGVSSDEIVIYYMANWGRDDEYPVARRRLADGQWGQLEHLDPADEQVRDSLSRQPAKAYFGFDPADWDEEASDEPEAKG